MSNFEIFDFFESNKRILLFLIKESIIFIDQAIFNIINDSKYWNEQYIKYFLIESKPFISDKLYNEIKEELNNQDLKNFEENRKNGENDSNICKLIRQLMNLLYMFHEQIYHFLAYQSNQYLKQILFCSIKM